MRNKKIVGTEFYVYAVNFLALAGATSATGQINIQSDADFVLQKLTQFTDIAVAIQTDSTRVLPLATILITSTASGRQISDIAVPLTSLFGTAEKPFILPASKVFKQNSTIQLTVANLTAATTYNIRLAFIGHKVYYAD